MLLGGVTALALAGPSAFFAFRLDGAHFAIGTWVIAEAVPLSVAMWKGVGRGTKPAAGPEAWPGSPRPST